MFYRIVEPILLHDLSFCHSSKQTTILADSGEVACSGGEANLLITEGESSVALVLRAVHFLVVDGKIKPGGLFSYP